jgi:hypothetical protein
MEWFSEEGIIPVIVPKKRVENREKGSGKNEKGTSFREQDYRLEAYSKKRINAF